MSEDLKRPVLILRWLFILMEIWIFRVASEDDFDIMSSSLKTFQVHASDGEELAIRCPESTVIGLNYAQYGRAPGQDEGCRQANPGITKDTMQDDNLASFISRNSLKVIEEKCRDQRACRLLTSPSTFKVDPCPEQKKYAEVAYRCRPDEFVNKYVCEGEKVRLSCHYAFRILVYSAKFGSKVKGVVECPQSADNKEDCGSNVGAESIRSCNGHRFCTILAHSDFFGNTNCSLFSRPYLKVVYKCVPKEVLKPPLPEEREHVVESPKMIKIYTTSYPAWAQNTEEDVYRVVYENSETPSNSIKSEIGSDNGLHTSQTNVSKTEGGRWMVEIIVQWISAHKILKGNKTSLILYTSLSSSIGLVVFIVGVALHSYFSKGKLHKNKLDIAGATYEEDFFSDSDMEHYDGHTAATSIRSNSNANIPLSNIYKTISSTTPRTPITEGDDQHFS